MVSTSKMSKALMAIGIFFMLATSAWATSSNTRSLAGTWDYVGTGTYNGDAATDTGHVVIACHGDVGNEVLDSLRFYGTARDNVTGGTLSYDYTLTMAITVDRDSFGFTSGGVAYHFTINGNESITCTQKGTYSSSGDTINATYDVTRPTESASSGDSGGGGCSMIPPMGLGALLLSVGAILIRRRAR